MINGNMPPHFTREEFLRSQTATRLGIDNTPQSDKIEAHIIETAWFLENLRSKLRAHYKRRLIITISSGYRCPELNKAIGGSKTSAHMKGWAGDINCPGLTPLELARFAAEHMKDEGYDQIIHEFGRWVHVGLAQEPRRQRLTATKENGKTVYKIGLLEV